MTSDILDNFMSGCILLYTFYMTQQLLDVDVHHSWLLTQPPNLLVPVVGFTHTFVRSRHMTSKCRGLCQYLSTVLARESFGTFFFFDHLLLVDCSVGCAGRIFHNYSGISILQRLRLDLSDQEYIFAWIALKSHFIQNLGIKSDFVSVMGSMRARVMEFWSLRKVWLLPETFYEHLFGTLHRWIIISFYSKFILLSEFRFFLSRTFLILQDILQCKFFFCVWKIWQD